MFTLLIYRERVKARLNGIDAREVVWLAVEKISQGNMGQERGIHQYCFLAIAQAKLRGLIFLVG
jgi:hypothetical protein